MRATHVRRTLPKFTLNKGPLYRTFTVRVRTCALNPQLYNTQPLKNTTNILFVGLYRLVLEYCGWYTANTLVTSVSNALSIGGGIVAAVVL